MKVEIFGSGCPKCKRTLEMMERAAQQLNKTIILEKVTDMNDILDRGIVSTPAVAVDGKLVSSGKVPSLEEAKGFLQKS